MSEKANNTAPIFGTVSVAMVTPFHADGSIDYDSAHKVASKLVADGCDCVLVSGTTGESPTTHREEKEKLIRVVRDAIGPDIFLLAGAGSNDTVHAVSMAKSAQAQGADGLLVVSPYYNRPSQEGLYQHVKAVHDVTDLPIMLYDIPGRTGLAFGDETLDRLAELPRIKGVKDATGNVEAGLVRMRRTGLQYYSGDDGLNFAWLTHGAVGVVSVVGHVAAASYRKMVDLVTAGEVKAACDLSHELSGLVQAVMGSGQGAVMAKHALALQGVIETPTVRLPLVNAPAAEVEALAQTLRQYQLL